MPSDLRGDRSTAGKASWGTSSVPDPVSPELVLVAPPDEAKRAREQLPEAPATQRDRRVSNGRVGPPPRPSDSPPRPAPRRRRWVRRTLLVGVLLLVVGSAVAIGLAGLRDNGSESTAQRKGTPVRRHSATVPSKTPVTTVAKKPQESGRSTSRPQSKQEAQPKASTTPKTAPAKKPAKKAAKKPTRPRSPGRPAVTGFVPARTWSWEPQSRARRYVFTLRRNGKRVIAARTAKPRYVLPNRFRFAAGRYRWRVVALTTKPARRKVVVDSKFRLSAAGAAAAND
jgi:hypothetical protein